MTRSALVVRGGWEGHHPVEATELFLPFLRAEGFEIVVEESPEVYADADRMAATLRSSSFTVRRTFKRPSTSLNAISTPARFSPLVSTRYLIIRSLAMSLSE